VTRCRICGTPNLVPVVNLGNQMLTGVFPRSQTQQVTVGPLCLVKCHTGDATCCGLLQLSCSYDLKEMYGENYGYRSGLNRSMIDHLHGQIGKILSTLQMEKGDLIVDIGSNDGTTLCAYPAGRYTLVGIDPTAGKFRQYYPPHVEIIPDFFSRELFTQRFGERRAKIVTSFSMFYDLEQPLRFMREIHDILHDQGVWVFEQSYMPTMLDTNSYDTICQEHLEYYGIAQIKWMTDRVGLKIVDVELSDTNGGSFCVTVAKTNAPYRESPDLDALLKRERDMRLDTPQAYRAFGARIQTCRSELSAFIERRTNEGKRIFGLGASTKGNVILQYCGITAADLPYIGEVNSDKFGCYTPGTYIPIIPEAEVLAMRPDYLLVLPWHFRSFFESSKKLAGMNLVFPLPKLEIVHCT
jgi:NDP-4-keto-2,6-dideoxyhexose 3-C-methyltransferase